jgi:hypothetical protein
MRCVECGNERDPSERGWVTVLSPLALVSRTTADAEVDEPAKDE